MIGECFLGGGKLSVNALTGQCTGFGIKKWLRVRGSGWWNCGKVKRVILLVFREKRGAQSKVFAHRAEMHFRYLIQMVCVRRVLQVFDRVSTGVARLKAVYESRKVYQLLYSMIYSQGGLKGEKQITNQVY